LQLAINGENYSLLAANIFLVLLSIVLAYQKQNERTSHFIDSLVRRSTL